MITKILKKSGWLMSTSLIALLLTSCGDFTDLEPKGENLLSSTEDLELLLNTDEYQNFPYCRDGRQIGGNCIYAFSDVTVPLTVDNKTADALKWGYFDDEQSLNRIADLTTSDDLYTSGYNIIGRVCNPILNRLETASGTEAKKNSLKAEALVGRAFCHYRVLQNFAPAFNGSNGDIPAIIYMTEDMSIIDLHEMNTLQECYDQMLKDVNDALELNVLPDNGINYMRWGRLAATALKAHILMGMGNYTEAEAAAKEVLNGNNNLYDYWANVEDVTSMFGVPYQRVAIDDRENPETLFMVPTLVYYMWVNPEDWNALEENYGLRGLGDVMSRAYAGYPEYADYGAQIGLPGWQATMDFEHYTNLGGLDVPQMYIIIAECELRNGNIGGAMNWLDQLRAKRLPADFKKLEGNVTSKADAISWLKKTVVAEFLWDDWTYIFRKRWNTEPEWQTTLTRTVGGKTYTLSPTSKLWISAFPKNAVEKNPNLTQNW